MDVRRLDPVPPGRVCAMCGGGLRFSHNAYVGRGERVAVHVCRGCGLGYRGAPRQDDDAGSARGAGGGGVGGAVDRVTGGRGGPAARGAERAERRRKPLPDEGAPDNPVIDEAMARRLRESLGGGGG